MSLFSETKKCVVFLGELKPKGEKFLPNPYATGFFISVEGICHLVTAKHVVLNIENGKFKDDITVFINKKNDKGINIRSIKMIKEIKKIEWIFHPDNQVDIAIIPFALDYEHEDVKIIPEKSFIGVDNLSELYNIFFLSYQPGIKGESKINPITRTGVISRINEDSSIYIDAPAFPGNSGSPVFVTPSTWRFEVNKLIFGKDQIAGKFIGIIGEFVPYSEIAISVQTGKPRVIFEENTGISKVWSINHINQIIQSQNFKNQISSIKSSIKKENIS